MLCCYLRNKYEVVSRNVKKPNKVNITYKSDYLLRNVDLYDFNQPSLILNTAKGQN